MRRKTIVPALVACIFAVLALTTATLQAQHAETSAAPMITKAIAVLHATKSGGDANGKVTFTKVAAGIKVEAEVHGLTPGPHGFHIHEFGDISSPDAMSTGGHFNPDKVDHAAPGAPKRHVGDMGNIEASPRGVARLDYVDPLMSFAGPHSIIGRGVIVHEKADDLKTQPTGNAGGRVAAGVVGVAKGS
jgi:Cu-Zn family superoxide dismutase